jgi:hypothetical protein
MNTPFENQRGSSAAVGKYLQKIFTARLARQNEMKLNTTKDFGLRQA